jgi:hypothetical protein
MINLCTKDVFVSYTTVICCCRTFVRVHFSYIFVSAGCFLRRTVKICCKPVRFELFVIFSIDVKLHYLKKPQYNV